MQPKNKINLLILFFILCALYPAGLTAQSDTKKFFEVGEDIFTSPKDFNSNDWIKFAGTAALTTAGFCFDNEVRGFSQTSKTDFFNTLFKIDDYYNLYTIAIADIAIWGYGSAANKNDIEDLGLKLTEATVYSTLINYFIKFLTGRSRPFLNTGNLDFNPIQLGYDQSSFPSLHSTNTFAFSKVMADEIDNIYWKITWFTASTLVSLARIYNDQHWLSDVILGAAIGYFVGEFVSNHSTNKKEDKVNPGSMSKFNITFNFAF
jgi:membrane-associated phospholipid phosphatase